MTEPKPPDIRGDIERGMAAVLADSAFRYELDPISPKLANLRVGDKLTLDGIDCWVTAEPVRNGDLITYEVSSIQPYDSLPPLYHLDDGIDS